MKDERNHEKRFHKVKSLGEKCNTGIIELFSHGTCIQGAGVHYIMRKQGIGVESGTELCRSDLEENLNHRYMRGNTASLGGLKPFNCEAY